MDPNQDIRHTGGYQFKKWTIFTFCSIGIVVSIVMVAMATKLVDTYVDDNYPTDSSQDRNTIKSAAKAIIWVVVGLTILFHLVGLVGSYKEHYCMIMTYAVLMTLATLGSIGTALKAPVYWTEFVISLLITCLSYSFAVDLRRRRVLMMSPVVVQTIPAQTTWTPMAPNYNIQTQQQYNPQFNNQNDQYYPTQSQYNPSQPQYNPEYGQQKNYN